MTSDNLWGAAFLAAFVFVLMVACVAGVLVGGFLEASAPACPKGQPVEFCRD